MGVIITPPRGLIITGFGTIRQGDGRNMMLRESLLPQLVEFVVLVECRNQRGIVTLGRWQQATQARCGWTVVALVQCGW